MIVNNLSNQQLIAYIKYYTIIIENSEESDKKNTITFREQCNKELIGRYMDCNRK